MDMTKRLRLAVDQLHRQMPPAINVSKIMKNQDDWTDLVSGLGVGGLSAELAQHCDFVQYADGRLVLSLDPAHEHLWFPYVEDRLRSALEAALGADLIAPLRLEIRIPRQAA